MNPGPMLVRWRLDVTDVSDQSEFPPYRLCFSSIRPAVRATSAIAYFAKPLKSEVVLKRRAVRPYGTIGCGRLFAWSSLRLTGFPLRAADLQLTMITDPGAALFDPDRSCFFQSCVGHRRASTFVKITPNSSRKPRSFRSPCQISCWT